MIELKILRHLYLQIGRPFSLRSPSTTPALTFVTKLDTVSLALFNNIPGYLAPTYGLQNFRGVDCATANSVHQQSESA